MCGGARERFWDSSTFLRGYLYVYECESFLFCHRSLSSLLWIHSCFFSTGIPLPWYFLSGSRSGTRGLLVLPSLIKAMTSDRFYKLQPALLFTYSLCSLFFLSLSVRTLFCFVLLGVRRCRRDSETSGEKKNYAKG